MATDLENAQAEEREKSWFKEELANFGQEDLHNNPSHLLLLAGKLKVSRASDKDLRKIKRCTLHYINVEIDGASTKEAQDFLSFLFQSELMEESTEVRISLYQLLRARIVNGLDRLSIEIAHALLRSRKLPSAQVLAEVHPKAKVQFADDPTWPLLSLLSLGVNNHLDVPYSIENLIADLLRLRAASPANFERSILVREPLWARLPQPISGAYLLERLGNSAKDKIERSMALLEFSIKSSSETAASL